MNEYDYELVAGYSRLINRTEWFLILKPHEEALYISWGELEICRIIRVVFEDGVPMAQIQIDMPSGVFTGYTHATNLYKLSPSTKAEIINSHKIKRITDCMWEHMDYDRIDKVHAFLFEN